MACLLSGFGKVLFRVRGDFKPGRLLVCLRETELLSEYGAAPRPRLDG